MSKKKIEVKEEKSKKKKVNKKKIALRVLVWAGLILIVLFFVGGGILQILGR